jgi:hypothetical protein
VARERPKASDVLPVLVKLDGGKPDPAKPMLTRAEANALRRSAPLTHARLARHFDDLTTSRQRRA